MLVNAWRYHHKTEIQLWYAVWTENKEDIHYIAYIKLNYFYVIRWKFWLVLWLHNTHIKYSLQYILKFAHNLHTFFISHNIVSLLKYFNLSFRIYASLPIYCFSYMALYHNMLYLICNANAYTAVIFSRANYILKLDAADFSTHSIIRKNVWIFSFIFEKRIFSCCVNVISTDYYELTAVELNDCFHQTNKSHVLS